MTGGIDPGQRLHSALLEGNNRGRKIYNPDREAARFEVNPVLLLRYK